MTSVKIKNIRLKGTTVLAPMANVNCATFRYFSKLYGASLIYSPMLHVDNLAYNNYQLMNIMSFNKFERPLAIQLVGNNVQSYKKSIEIIDSFCDIIDINFGCPDKNIISANSGSYFLKHLDKMNELINKISSYTNKPLTVKIRLGFDKIETEKIIKSLNRTNISAIAIHARTVKEFYFGLPHYDEIRTAKSMTDKIIIANGNIDDKNSLDVLKKTNADLLMIGRKAIGNPFIFYEINSLLSEPKQLNKTALNFYEVNKQNKFNFCKLFYNIYLKKQNIIDISELKFHLMSFINNIPSSKKFRFELSLSKSLDDVERILRQYSSN